MVDGYVYYVFFFSSRRRHTRYWRDWSSDVCSSDLSRIDADDLVRDLGPRLDAGPRKRLVKALEKARTRDTLQAFGKLTEVVDGRLRIRAEPPLLVPLRDLLPETEERDLVSAFRGLVRPYRSTPLGSAS